MPSLIGDLVVNLIGNDVALLAASSRSAKALESLAATSEVTTAKITKGMSEQEAAAARTAARIQTLRDTFSTMGKYAAVALGVIGAYSVKTAGDFQAAMEQIHTQAGASQEAVEGLSKAVLQLAPTVGFAPVELAKSLYHVESAFASTGISAKDAMSIVEMAAHNAAFGMSNLEDATQAMIGVMAVGFKDVRNAADAAAYLNATVGMGDMRMQQLSASIATNVLPTFAVAGLQMKDFSAALATMTDNVTPANMAATRLRMTVALLEAPTKAAFKALESVGLGADEARRAMASRQYLDQYGVSVSMLSEDLRKPDGLLVAITDLKTHLEHAGLSAVEQAAVIERAFGGGRTSAAIQTLLVQSDRLRSKYVELGTQAERAARAQEAWEQQQKLFKQQTHELGAALQVMAINLGDKLLPPLTKFVSFLSSHQGVMEAFFGTLLVFLGLLTIAWIAEAVANMIALWPVYAILAAVMLVAFGIYELVKHWSTVWGFIKDIALDVWHALVTAWNATWKAIVGVVKDVGNALAGAFHAVGSALSSAWRAVWKAISATASWIKSIWIDPLIAIFHGFVETMKFSFNMMMIPVKFFAGFFGVIFGDLVQIVKMAWNAISGWFNWANENIFKPAAGLFYQFVYKPIADAFLNLVAYVQIIWNQIVYIFSWAWQQILRGWHGFENDVINPVVSAVKWVGARTVDAAHVIANAFSWAWGAIKAGWNGFYKVTITPIINAAKAVGDVFKAGWKVVVDAVSAAWNKLKPIFDKIRGAIDTVMGAFHEIANSPGDLGAVVAHLLGFAQGGVVPGPIGAPQLAVVHGGEVVLPNSVTGAIRGGGPVRGGPISPSASAYTSALMASDSPVYAPVYVDGQKLFQVIVTRAQRHKGRNNSTFLT